MTLPSPIPLSPTLLPRRQYVGETDIPRILTEDELQEYLEDTDDLQNTYRTWDKSSGYPRLLTAREKEEIKREKREKTLKVIAGLLIAYWILSEKRGIYQYGYYHPIGSYFKPVTPLGLRTAVIRLARAAEREMRALTAQLVNGTIGREQWYSSVVKIMKNEYRAAWLASAGGIDNMAADELRRFSDAARVQMRYLNNFMDELISGKQKLNGRVIIRAGMYGRAGYAIFENNLMTVATRNGMREGKRILGENDNHCHDSNDTPGCIELVAKGWVPIAQLTPLGSATCRSNDLCHHIYRR